MNLEEMKQAVVDALEDVKATEISVLDVSGLTSVTSFMIIASGSSNRQTRALADNVQKKLKEKGAQIYGVEGEQEGEWVLVDLGDIVVHIMLPATRDYYNLEQLWGAAESRRQSAKASG
ncbi:MAG TPA: ribosome silencing factor [Novimethylophilus sp.]|jgi:ribosome-associated protein|uniref:ribosome silencing factor n=1 Tax=Novimethylophilus sp. TaxID=2137426 RepID=UPI002F42B877